MTFKSMDAIPMPRPDVGSVYSTEDIPEGGFHWSTLGDDDVLIYRTPGADYCRMARVTRDPEKQDRVGMSGTYWWWDGDESEPTILPSIGVPGKGPYDWHGHLTGGRWIGV